jgi:nicotinamide riboside kinase
MFFVFTGPESSGKTTLACHASSVFSGGLVHEFAREYLEKKNGFYTFKDLKKIAENQHRLELEQQHLFPYVWCDTDMITIFIWSLEKFNKVSPVVEKYLQQQNESNRFYFLCTPDIPWEHDILRENPEDRERIFELYLAFLKKHEISFTILQGSKESKENTISEVFASYFNNNK